jgi:hypothetical protein
VLSRVYEKQLGYGVMDAQWSNAIVSVEKMFKVVTCCILVYIKTTDIAMNSKKGCTKDKLPYKLLKVLNI